MAPLSQPIELILFDIDGTLLLPKGSGRASTQLAMMEIFQTDAGLDTHHFGGKTDWRTLNELLSAQGHTLEAIAASIPAYEVAMAQHLMRIIGDYPVEACVGAHAAVAELLRRGTPLPGIVTGNVKATAPIKLKAAGFDPDWFPVGAYGSEAHDRNELPGLAVERAEQHLGRKISPEQVVVIGDTPADVECARSLGAVAVVVMTGFTTREQMIATNPDYLLDDLSTFFGEVIP